MKALTLNYRFIIFGAVLFAVNSSFVAAQTLKPGPQDLSFFSTVDETDQPYAIYIPENFDQSKSYPLVVFLHGAWSNHRLGLRRLFGVGNRQGYDFIKPGNVPFETDVEATRYFPPFKPVDYIAAAPYARGTAGYQGIPEQDVYEMLDDLKSRFHIDEDRIYLTGLSMGGGGTLWLGLTRPDIWAAIAPVCPAPPDGTEELAGHPQFNPAQKVSVKVDGKSFTAKTSDAVSFMKSRGTWSNKKFTPGLTSKQPGAEGPLYAAASSNHIYVYGTGGNPSQEELAARRDQAASAADWTGRGGRIMVFPRVISDKEVRPSDYVTSNLILFGTRETNAIIEKFADNLPMHLNTDASGYGLVYIFPLNRHYVLVNSGLPWWTPPKIADKQSGLEFMGSKIEVLNKFQDFVLFKETPDNIII